MLKACQWQTMTVNKIKLTILSIDTSFNGRLTLCLWPSTILCTRCANFFTLLNLKTIEEKKAQTIHRKLDRNLLGQTEKNWESFVERCEDNSSEEILIVSVCLFAIDSLSMVSFALTPSSCHSQWDIEFTQFASLMILNAFRSARYYPWHGDEKERRQGMRVKKRDTFWIICVIC